MHFAEGLASSDIDRLAFTTEDGSKYAVSAVIEYKTSPNHFAIWQREPPLDKPGLCQLVKPARDVKALCP